MYPKADQTADTSASISKIEKSLSSLGPERGSREREQERGQRQQFEQQQHEQLLHVLWSHELRQGGT